MAAHHSPACTTADPALFDSTHPLDHLHARAICDTCPLVQPCIHRACDVARKHAHEPALRGPDGTWGGLLWRAGRVVDPRRVHTWKEVA